MRDLSFSRAGALSYDGRYVAYTRLPRYGPGDIFLLPTDGSGVEHALIDDAADDRFVGWTPDGRSILFTSDRAETTDLWSAAVTNGRVDDLPGIMMRAIGDTETSQVEGISITSRGTLYYSKYSTLNSDVQVVSLDPGTAGILSPPRSITTNRTGYNPVPRWSPDGSRIAYTTSRTRAAPPITILSEDSWRERQIQLRLDSEVSFWDFNWAPDGRSFLVSVTSAPASARGLYRVDAQTGETTALLTRRGAGGTPPYLTHAAWLPDGRSIVFVEAQRVVIRNMVTAEERSVYEFGGSVHSMELSPDGHQLAAAVRGKG